MDRNKIGHDRPSPALPEDLQPCSFLLNVQEAYESFSAKFVLILFSVKVDLKS